jgi:hypothetical protein
MKLFLFNIDIQSSHWHLKERVLLLDIKLSVDTSIILPSIILPFHALHDSEQIILFLF